MAPVAEGREFGAKPTDYELERLVYYYPAYEKAHRKAILRGYFDGDDKKQIVDAKLAAGGLPSSEASARSRGGHGRSVQAKVLRIQIRLHYLYLRVDVGLSKRRANAALLSHAPSTSTDLHILANSIARITRSVRLDKEQKSEKPE
jgi:hypothetical protein